MYVKFAIAVLVWRSRKEGYESLRDLSKESLIVRGRSVKERSHPSLFSASDGWIRHSCLVSMATHKERYWRYWIRSTPCRTFVNNDYSRYSSVSSMLTDLNRPSLQSRRRICDLVCFIKYMTWRSSEHLPSPWLHLHPCVRMRVQGPVTTLRSDSHPLLLTLTNTFSVRCLWHRTH